MLFWGGGCDRSERSAAAAAAAHSAKRAAAHSAAVEQNGTPPHLCSSSPSAIEASAHTCQKVWQTARANNSSIHPLTAPPRLLSEIVLNWCTEPGACCWSVIFAGETGSGGIPPLC